LAAAARWWWWRAAAPSGARCRARAARRARTSGFRARLATPGGRRTLKLRRKKGRKYLAPAGAPNMWNKAKRKNLK
jgi:large subunit ribosomal protein L34